MTSPDPHPEDAFGRPDFAAPAAPQQPHPAPWPAPTGESPVPGPESAAGPTPSGQLIEERLHPLSPLVRAWVFVLAGGYALISTLAQGQIRWEDVTRVGPLIEQVPGWALGLIAALLLSLGFGYWGWWTTKIVIDDHELRVENTGAFQESKRIAFSRIQSVDIHQRLAARLLGLAEVTIDVGADSPTTLAFLTRKRATEIRDYLMARAHRQHVGTTDTQRQASAWDDSAQGDQVLIRLNPGEIILGALLSSELPFLLVAFLVPLGLSIWLQQPLIALGAGVLPLLIAMGGFLSKRLIGQFNYTLATTPAGIRLTRGLTTLHSQTIPVHRVQSVQISQPLLWRPLKRARLTLTVLGLKLGEDSQDLSTIYLPIGDPRQIQLALAALWPNLRLEDLRFHRTPRRARWLSPLSWSWLGYASDGQVLAVRDGWFERRQTIIPHARLQSMQLAQGPLERRLRLVTVVALTGGTLNNTRIKHLQADQARALAFGEMDLARAARGQELLAPAPTGAAWRLAAPTPVGEADEVHLWTPSTSVQGALPDPPADAPPGIPTDR
ncbi:MAG TPA: PH domain-containing protein [Propioniciclava sp.]|uniref:PH domain-containing protein n=1 Tax=Propioniciclava sp. TaxID=2038686 RepID=UPI002C46C8B4|nr:PH domain-containing protein [Propioniciclava sp.]HRL49131.1 PH domain-containing protein [Propioniciclava sp.]HRL79360.1 PH domain-containing protein [Propioniciclava sp.]